MSRGNGKSQREVLETLEVFGPYYLSALADDDFSARYKSLYRAACRLEEQAQITLIKYTFGSRKLAIAPAGLARRTYATPLGSVAGFDVDRDAIKANSQRLAEHRHRRNLLKPGIQAGCVGGRTKTVALVDMAKPSGGADG